MSLGAHLAHRLVRAVPPGNAFFALPCRTLLPRWTQLALALRVVRDPAGWAGVTAGLRGERDIARWTDLTGCLSCVGLLASHAARAVVLLRRRHAPFPAYVARAMRQYVAVPAGGAALARLVQWRQRPRAWLAGHAAPLPISRHLARLAGRAWLCATPRHVARAAGRAASATRRWLAPRRALQRAGRWHILGRATLGQGRQQRQQQQQQRW